MRFNIELLSDSGDPDMALTDKQWAMLGPLIERCCTHHKAHHHDMRQTINTKAPGL